MDDASADVALHVRPQHGEGPLWDDETARLWWVDIAGERVHCFDPQSSYDCSWNTGCQPGGVVLSALEDPLVALPEGLALLDRATGTFDPGTALGKARSTPLQLHITHISSSRC
jgi:sugar lactone lactonase YvrE